jgi:hypothetical protein
MEFDVVGCFPDGLAFDVVKGAVEDYVSETTTEQCLIPAAWPRG